MKKIRAKIKAPENLSDAIDLAVTDLIRAEKSKLHEICMGSWHEKAAGICEVCFAGSVMAMSFETDPHQYLDPVNFSNRWFKIFHSLDNIRTYNIYSSLREFYPSMGDEKMEAVQNKIRYIMRYLSRIHYLHDNVKFKRRMTRIASELRKLGY